MGKIEILEKCFLKKKIKKNLSKRINPLEDLTKIKNRSYSIRCQKLTTDFGIEESFQQAALRMKEHHGVDINISAVRTITEHHASRAFKINKMLPSKTQPSNQMVVEMDGEMVPLVEYENSNDRRKTKKNIWSELRIGVAQNFGEANWKYACSFESPDQLGERLLSTMLKLGFNHQTQVHGIGDGALWIVEQGEKIAGIKFNYLIDLFHLCEYLSKAITAWTKKEDIKKEIYKLKERLKKGEIIKVLQELKKQQQNHPTHEGIASCIRYIENRPNQFKYKEAIEKELPIGSGKVESTHRSLMQKRLKKPGSWWLRENAAKMADLRTLRANGGWEFLWKQNYVSNFMAA